jgi:hypothetical protein
MVELTQFIPLLSVGAMFFGVLFILNSKRPKAE